MSALAEAKAWALREAWKELHDSEHGLKEFVAQRVPKQGGGHPSAQSIGQLYRRIDADREWYPGKGSGTPPGPEPALTGAKRACIARSAMTMKESGIEPTYGKVLAACPKAALNPATGKPVSPRLVYNVFREDCFDEDDENNWTHKARYSKTALTEDQEKKRYAFAKLVKEWGRTDVWFYNHVVWTDLCNSVLPRSEKKANEQALARKGKKGWVSAGCELWQQNLKGKAECLKQSSWDTVRWWWAPVLCKGKLHVEMLSGNFAGECEEGAAELVEKVRAGINCRFQGGTTQPDHVFTDRGRGFYNTGSGKITKAYLEALKENGLKPVLGENASQQPGNIQEILLCMRPR